MTYVTFDPENGDLNLALPPEYMGFHDEICLKLAENFSGSLDGTLLEKMNQFVGQWLDQKKNQK